MKKQLATLAAVMLSAASAFGMKLGVPQIGRCRAKAPTYITIPLLDDEGTTTNLLSSVVFDGDARPYIVLDVDYPYGSSSEGVVEERAVFYDINNGVMRFSRTFSTNEQGLTFFVQQGYLNLNGSEFYYTPVGGLETQMDHGLIVWQSQEVTIEEGINDDDINIYQLTPLFENTSSVSTTIKIANSYDGARFKYFDPSNSTFDPQDFPSAGYTLLPGRSVHIWVDRSTPLSAWNPNYRSGFTSTLRRFTTSNGAAKLKVSGDLYYLLRSPTLESGAFAEMFSEMASLVDTEDLRVLVDETVASYASNAQNVYAGMFRGSGVTNTLSFNALQGVVNGFGGACERMYYNCKALRSAAYIDISSISGSSLFQEAFTGCTALKTVAGIRVPSSYSKSAAANTFYNTFKDCLALTEVGSNIPIFDAQYAQYYMFNGSGITGANLTVASRIDSAYCMMSMFADCSSMESVAVSRDFNVAGERSADNMFANCTSLVSAFPGRTITSTGDRSASSMFSKCLSLKTAPPVTLGSSSVYGCYDMFADSGVTNATVSLPSSVPNGGCVGMYRRCADLRSAVLSRSGTMTVGEYGLEGMFDGCTGLSSVSLPKLGNIGKWGCYDMFYGCSSLREVPFSGWSGTVEEFGFFGMFAGSGIENIEGLTLEASTQSQGDGAFTDMFQGCQDLMGVYDFKMLNVWDSSGMFENCPNLTSISNCEFSVYGPRLRPMWTNLVEIYDTKITVSSPTYTNSCEYFFIANDDLLLVNGLTLNPGGSVGAFHHMFSRCRSLETVENLVLPRTLPARTCESMFSECHSLRENPSLEFDSLGEYACHNMFYGCVGLGRVNGVRVNYGGKGSMRMMFDYCSSVTNVSDVMIRYPYAASDPYDYNDNEGTCWNMFRGCTNITTITGLCLGTDEAGYANPTPFIPDGAFWYMFPATMTYTLGVNIGSARKASLRGIFRFGCSAITHLHSRNMDPSTLRELLANSDTVESIEDVDVKLWPEFDPVYTNRSYKLPSVYVVPDKHYGNMFVFQKNLKQVKDAKFTISDYCYSTNSTAVYAMHYEPGMMFGLFSGCTNLVAVTNLTLASDYNSDVMFVGDVFKDCGELRDVSGFKIKPYRGSIGAWLNWAAGSFLHPLTEATPWTALFGGCDKLEVLHGLDWPRIQMGYVTHYEPPVVHLQNGYGEGWTPFFQGMTSLRSISGIPSWMVRTGDLFKGCTNLEEVSDIDLSSVTVPFLVYVPKPTMYEQSWDYIQHKDLTPGLTAGIFDGCTKLARISGINVSNPGAIPSTIFANLPNLKEVDGLTFSGDLSDTDAASMFSGTSLDSVRDMTVTNVMNMNALMGLFSGTSVKDASGISVTDIGVNVCRDMFRDCTSLTNASGIVYGSIGEAGCFRMFAGCTSLTQAPDMMATGRTINSYGSMFSGCSSLSSLLTGQTSWTGCDNWLLDVSPTGTFTCPSTLDTSERGPSTCPAGWAVVH